LDVLVAGGHKDALCIACLYISCNQGSVPRSFKEICAASTSTRKQVAKCYKEIMKLLKLEDNTQGREREFVERFCSTLGMGRDIFKLATAIADAATETDLFPDRGPDVVCGASILLASVASNQVIRMRDMVQVSGATRNGLSVAYKTLASNTEKVYPADFLPSVKTVDLPKADEL
jgi:transcription initiation factor TFIIB